MTLKEIFVKVCLGVPVEQNRLQNSRYEETVTITPMDDMRFLNAYEDTVNELVALFPGFVFNTKYGNEITGDVPDRAWQEKDLWYEIPDNINDDNPVRPLYWNAIVDNILFLTGNGTEANKTEFARKARTAYGKYWTDNAKGKIIKRLRW